MRASGIYLRVLREARYSNRQLLADELGVDDSQIERVEKGLHSTRSPFLFAFIRAVRGNPYHVIRLVLKKDATEEEARALARDWLDRGAHLSFDEQEERRKRASALIDELFGDPRKLDKWMDYGAQLLEQDRRRDT